MDTSEGAMREHLAEFIGTYMLVFAVGCNVIAGNPVWAVVSIACTLMVSIYALGSVSGGHFNPAVTIGAGIAFKQPPAEVAARVGVQVLAGILSAISYSALLMEAIPFEPVTGAMWWQAGLVELLYTFMLVFVVLNVACTGKHKEDQFKALAVGFVIVAGGYAAAKLSGGCFNPAVALGIDVAGLYRGRFGWSLVYTVFELAGAALAAGLFKVVRPDPEDVEPVVSTKSRLVSEFLGTYMLVLTVGLNVLGKPRAAAFSIAASLMCMIYALGSVSGAHFNPAVTLALVLSGKHTAGPDPRIDALQYVGVQLLGGLCGACTYVGLMAGQTFSLGPVNASGWYEAWLVEVVFTFLLAFVVLSVAAVEKKPKDTQFVGLAIGSCVTAGGFAAGGISGGSLNPAVSFGIALTSLPRKNCLLQLVAYVIAELMGGALAAAAFYATRPEEVALKGELLPLTGGAKQAN